MSLGYKGWVLQNTGDLWKNLSQFFSYIVYKIYFITYIVYKIKDNFYMFFRLIISLVELSTGTTTWNCKKRSSWYKYSSTVPIFCTVLYIRWSFISMTSRVKMCRYYAQIPHQNCGIVACLRSENATESTIMHIKIPLQYFYTVSTWFYGKVPVLVRCKYSCKKKSICTDIPF